MTIENYLHQHHTKQTAESYLHCINKYLLKHPNAALYGYTQVIQYLDEIKPINGRKLASIKRYYDYLIDTNKRTDHPCKTLIVSRSKNHIQFQELFTTQELEILLQRESRYMDLKARNQSILSFLIYQGLSSENIIRMAVDDLNFDAGTIYIKATPKLKRRTLELKAKQMNYIYKYLYQNRTKLDLYNSDKLFIGKLGEGYTVDALNRLIRPQKALFPDRNLNTRTIRQSVIANWLNEFNIPLEDVQLLAGHKWLSSTEKYKTSRPLRHCRG